MILRPTNMLLILTMMPTQKQGTITLGLKFLYGKVVQCARDHDGELTRSKHHNPILNTHFYQVKFSDGEIGEYSTNSITQDML